MSRRGRAVPLIWEAAAADEDRASPKPARNLALGLLLGALVGLAIVLVGLFRDHLPGDLRLVIADVFGP